MSLSYDREADAIYIVLRDVSYHHGKDLDHARRIDLGADGKPMGIELLNVSHGVDLRDLPERDAVGQLLEQHSIKIYA